MSKIRVMIVDDHALVRLGLITLVNDQGDMEVVGEAGNAPDAVRGVERLQPDVVLMDIRMPGEGGIEATRQICARFPHTKVVILTSFADDELVMHAIQAGAVGYVLKEADNAELLRAISAAVQGKSALDPTVTMRLLAQVREQGRRAEENAFHDLSEGEMNILAELTRGKTNAEIARALSLSEKTVRNHVSAILEKLDLSNRVELATYAVEHHIFDHVRKE
ncbi:MAG TPA: response regulator transcription factor [Anaerolineaceae bacterium]|nr:response regulator transcription factor [Anaerolineaceae bacterium]